MSASELPGIAVFFITSTAVAAGFRTALVELLEDQGHEALLVTDLDPAQADLAETLQISRVSIATAVIALDLLPMTPRAAELRKSLDNPKITKAIERARHLVGGDFGPLVSTRNSADSWQAIRVLFPGMESELRAEASRRRRLFARKDAVRDLTREGRRAKVELVEFNGELAVRKTYRPTALRYMQREVEVLRQLDRPELPKLLHEADDHIVISYVENGRNLDLEHRGGRPTPLPLKTVRAIADFIRACVAAGFDPIDLRAPGNVIITERGLKVIDFELWRRCSSGARAQDALCLTGVPANDTERPRGVASFSKPYAAGWYPLTLLSPESFLYDPAWLQRLKRGVNFIRIWGSRAVGAAGRRLRARTRPPPRRNPRYIPSDLGVDGVIAELNRRNVRYAVLRWFDNLPELPTGGDLDLLVHDEDIDAVDHVLDANDGIAECDVFSVSGLPGTMYSGFPHLPPKRAAEILESARLFNGMYRAPTPEEYFLSLAFHAVYHKGFKTGLPSRHAAPPGIPAPKNDYLGTLGRLADELGLKVELSLEGLHDYLVFKGWAASPEMLKALARRNAWIRAHAL